MIHRHQNISRRGFIKIGTANFLLSNVGILRASLPIGAAVAPHVTTSAFADDSPALGSSVPNSKSGYDNLSNWPGATNRPVFADGKLSWIGPVGGGPSTSNDQSQSISLTASGNLHLTIAGQIIVGKDIAGTVQVSANDITIRQCRIRASAFWLCSIDGGVDGLTLEDCEIDGINGHTDGCTAVYVGNTGSAGKLGANCVVRRCNIHGACNGMSVGHGPITFVDNWVNGMATSGSGHMNGIQHNGGDLGQINIQHNTIENNKNQTDCIMLDDFYGQIKNVLVDRNLLRGGGAFCIYLDTHFGGTKPVNIIVTNNAMQKTSPFYAAGYHNFNPNYPNTYSGNYDYLTNVAIR
jgi:hypothetical protein